MKQSFISTTNALALAIMAIGLGSFSTPAMADTSPYTVCFLWENDCDDKCIVTWGNGTPGYFGCAKECTQGFNFCIAGFSI
jgi:hypothetical protein